MVLEQYIAQDFIAHLSAGIPFQWLSMVVNCLSFKKKEIKAKH